MQSPFIETNPKILGIALNKGLCEKILDLLYQTTFKGQAGRNGSLYRH